MADNFSKSQLEQLQQQSRGGKVIQAGTKARAAGKGFTAETAARLGAATSESWKNWKQKMTKSWNLGTDAPTTATAVTLRILGYRGAADFWDKFRAVDKKKIKEIRQGKGKTAKEKKSDSGGDEGVVASEIETINGTLVRIENRMGLLATAIIDVGSDVTEVKRMLQPQSFIATYGDGEKKKFTFNPLAPEGNQLMSKGEDGSLTPMGKNIVEKIAEQTALLTTELTLKDKEEDEKRAELRLKREQHLKKYVDPEERDRNNPLALFRKETNANFEKVFSLLKDGGEVQKKGSRAWWDKIMNTLTFLGVWGKKIMPFLRILLKFGRMLTGVGLAAFLGYELGKWLNEKFKISEKIVDAIFKIQEWWQSVDLKAEWNNIKDFIKNLPETMWNAAKNLGEDLAENLIRQIHKLSGGLLFDDTVKGWDNADAERRRKQQQEKLLRDAEIEINAMRDADELRSALQELKTDIKKTPRSDDNRDRMIRRKEIMQEALDLIEKREASKAAAARLNSSGKVYPIHRPGQPEITAQEIIAEAARRVGVSPSMALAVARQESNFDPKAKAGTSSALGLFQFTEDTWETMVERYGKKHPIIKLENRENAAASAMAGALLMKEHMAILKNKGIAATPDKLYTMHFLGAGRANTLFNADPNAIAADLFPGEVSDNNFDVFYKSAGNPRTVGELRQWLSEKINPYADQYAANPRFNGREIETDSIETASAQRSTVVQKEFIPVPTPVSTGGGGGVSPAVILASAGSNTNDSSLLRTAARDHPSNI